MARDPNELGALFIQDGTGKGAGRKFFSGLAFDVPEHGITVKLEPFSYERDGVTKYGVRVIKSETQLPKPKEGTDNGDVPF